MTTEAAAAASTTIAEQAIANAEPAKTAQVEGKTAIPGEGVKDSGPDSFVEEETALQALIAEQARLDAEAAGKVAEKPKEGEAAGSTGEVKEGDAAAAEAKAKADATALAAAAATNPQTQAIIALRKQNAELRGALLVKEGETRALRSMVGKTGAEADDAAALAAQQPTIDEALTAIEAEREALAEKVDAGQLTMVAYTKEVNALGRRERELVLAEAQAAASANAAPAKDLALEQATTALLTDVPVLAKLTTGQLDPINALAYQQLALEGRPITSDSPAETLRLRQRMAYLAEQFYDPAAHTARQAKAATAAAAAKAAGQPAPAAGNVSALPTAAQREAKLALAAAMPPEIGKVGAGATAGELTEAQIEAGMSGNEDQRIAFMEQHPTIIQKVMGPGYRVRR